MHLTSPQLEQFQEALLDAYTGFGLRQMLRMQLDVDLDRMAGGENLTELTFSRIRFITSNLRRRARSSTATRAVCTVQSTY